MAESPTTCPTFPIPPQLHDWPGDVEEFDADDYEPDEDDLPG
jgi:hypothetical protein